jgi:hypothetical protein
MFCDVELVFDGTRASGPVFMFCAPKLVLGGTEGVGSRSHVLLSLTRFGRYRGCWVPLSCLALPDSFSMILRAPCFIFIFCAPGPVLSGSEGVISRFHVLRSRTRFGRCRGRRVPFSCHALLNPFWAVRRALGPIFMLRALRLIFRSTEGVF